MANFIWLVIALPVLGALFNGILGRRVGYQVVSMVGPAVVLAAFLVGVGAFIDVLNHQGEAIQVHLWTWATIGNFNVPVTLLVDPVSATMVLVVTGIGFLIHVYATDYMVHHDHDHTHPDRDFARFFTFLNIFIASMLILVLGNNYALMFVGWELVGACSYLLIGFWYDRTEDPQRAIEIDGAESVSIPSLLSPAASGMKAFVVNRIGDVGFALGIFLIWSTIGSLEFTTVFEKVHELDHNTISWIALLLFVGAMGKSAQIPLYVWLPDAMAGPTPVSALIHAATMVTAGVYMIVRSHAIYNLAPEVSLFIAFVGAITAFIAGTIALVQVDLKRVLAYSTVSQLGYMFMAVGVGAYSSGMFHLVTHAFFKACLFLGAGSVMHALHDVIDIRRMGGLKDKMPHTYRTFFIAGLALAGIPPMSGFFSKDEIMAKAFEASPILWGIGIVTAGMTAFYTFRAIFIAFHGEPRDHHLYEHAHENRSAVTVPLWILAALATFGGLLGLPAPILNELGIPIPHLLDNWLKPVLEIAHGEAHHLSFMTEVVLLLTSSVVAIGSVGLAYFFYVVNPEIPKNLARTTRPLFAVLANKYYVDEIYNSIIVQPALNLSKTMAQGVDMVIIDKGIVDGVAKVIGMIGGLLGDLQSGYIRHYALATFIGALLMVGYFFFR